MATSHRLRFIGNDDKYLQGILPIPPCTRRTRGDLNGNVHGPGNVLSGYDHGLVAPGHAQRRGGPFGTAQEAREATGESQTCGDAEAGHDPPVDAVRACR